MKRKTGGEKGICEERKEGRKGILRIERSRGTVRSLRITHFSISLVLSRTPARPHSKQAVRKGLDLLAFLLGFFLSRIRSLQRFRTTGMRRREAIRNPSS